jgi:hypothetical protein
MTDTTPKLIAHGNSPMAIVPSNIDEVFRIAQLADRAGMAKNALPKIEEKVVALMAGLEVGFKPIQSLKWIAVIHGTPSIWGDGALALITSSDLLEDMDEGVDYDDKGQPVGAWCEMKRAGRKTPIRRTFTKAHAEAAGLWSKSGPWKQYPQRMLQMRARMLAMRDGFPDLLGGMSIAEEMQDMGDLTPQPDGSYGVPPRPAIPTREEIVESHKDDPAPETYPLVDHYGEVIGEYQSGEFGSRYVEAIEQVAELGIQSALNTFIDNNADAVKAINEAGIEKVGALVAAIIPQAMKTAKRVAEAASTEAEGGQMDLTRGLDPVE